MMWRFEGTRGQEDVLDHERGGGQPGGDDKVDSRLPIKSITLVAAGSFPRSDWCVVAATALASPIAAVRINVLLPSLLIASLVAAASLFCSGPYLLSVCLTSV